VIFTLSVPSLQGPIKPGVEPALRFWHRFTAFRRD
jgi:hypothetical protein